MSAGELRDALARDELVAYFQPQIDLVSEVVLGVEALVRWEHPQRGLLPPAAFLDAAALHGLLGPLTERMLRTSLQALKRFRRSGHDLTVAVNVGPETLASPAFATTVADLLGELDVAAPLLRLEVTETAVMESGDAAIEALGRLRTLGLGASLDDFGTGFSSLARLRTMPIDEVKIDRSFVADMRSHGDMTVVRMIIDLARHLELRVVAEGVEEHEDLAVLAGLGCDAAQGYWIARPAPVDDLEAWLLGRQQPVSLRPRHAAISRNGDAAERPTRRDAALSPPVAQRLGHLLRSMAAEHGSEVAACWVRARGRGRTALGRGLVDHRRRRRGVRRAFALDGLRPGRRRARADLADGQVAVRPRPRRRRRGATAAGRDGGRPADSARAAAARRRRGRRRRRAVRSRRPAGRARDGRRAGRPVRPRGRDDRPRSSPGSRHAPSGDAGRGGRRAGRPAPGPGTDAVPAGVAAAALAVAEADAVILWEPAPGGKHLRVSHAIGWPGNLPDVSIAGERSGAGAAFGSGTSTFIPDAAHHALPHAGLVAQLPVASAFYEPIHRGARVVGVIALAWKRPRHALCPATRTALELVADAASMALGRPVAESAPRFSR